MGPKGPNVYKLVQMGQIGLNGSDGSKWVQMGPSWSNWVKIRQNWIRGSKWVKIIKNGSRQVKMDPNGMGPDGSKWVQLEQKLLLCKSVKM